MGNTVTFEISQDILDSARLNPSDLKLELAISLYAQGRLSIGKAHELAGISLWQFRQTLAARKISAHYEHNDLQDDLNSVNNILDQSSC